MTWSHTITVKSIDNSYYSKTITKNVVLWWKDISAPKIILKNPASWVISLKENTSFNLRASFSDISPIRSVNVYFNWKKVLSSTNRKIVTLISTEWLKIWTYNVKIEAADIHFNRSSKNITVNIIE